jgi:hypothetical protein
VVDEEAGNRNKTSLYSQLTTQSKGRKKLQTAFGAKSFEGFPRETRRVRLAVICSSLFFECFDIE